MLKFVRLFGHKLLLGFRGDKRSLGAQRGFWLLLGLLLALDGLHRVAVFAGGTPPLWRDAAGYWRLANFVVEGDLLTLEAKNVLWVHGLFGQSEPDVGDVLAGALTGAEAVADFRVSQATTFHDWLVTHLTLGFVRMKTVVVEGDLVRAAPDTAR